MLSRSSSKLLRKELLERSRGASYFSIIYLKWLDFGTQRSVIDFFQLKCKA